MYGLYWKVLFKWMIYGYYHFRKPLLGYLDMNVVSSIRHLQYLLASIPSYPMYPGKINRFFLKKKLCQNHMCDCMPNNSNLF